MSRSMKDNSMAFLLFYCSWMDPKGFFALNIADYFMKPLDQFDVDIEPNLSIIKY